MSATFSERSGKSTHSPGNKLRAYPIVYVHVFAIMFILRVPTLRVSMWCSYHNHQDCYTSTGQSYDGLGPCHVAVLDIERNTCTKPQQNIKSACTFWGHVVGPMWQISWYKYELGTLCGIHKGLVHIKYHVLLVNHSLCALVMRTVDTLEHQGPILLTEIDFNPRVNRLL